MTAVTLDGESLTPEALERVAREQAPVRISADASERVRTARARIERILDDENAVYGVNTGFGDLVSERIPRAEIATLQSNLLRSHSVGLGSALPVEIVRGMLVTRINALVKGHSGVREAVIDLLVGMLNEEVHPFVPRYGSLGASGDLAPLAHMASVLIGEGEALVGTADTNEWLPGEQALEQVGLEPIELTAKEGIALINGTQLTTAIAALVVLDAERVLSAGNVAGAMTTEATFSTTTTCDPRISEVRPHPGHARVAARIRQLTADSEILPFHEGCDRVQDPYSIRCLPQVHGAIADAISHLRSVVSIELNSATDNPLIFDPETVDQRARETGVLSCGNFHGEPLALPLDYVSNALIELAAIAERRIDRLQNPHLQEDHLPPFLTDQSGLQSGLMIAQYTAASLLNASRSTHAPSVDNAVVSANQEDHVSMSATSALRAHELLAHTRAVVAIELLCATEALEYVPDLSPGVGSQAAVECVRRHVAPLEDDRSLSTDIQTIEWLVQTGRLEEAVEETIGK